MTRLSTCRFCKDHHGKKVKYGVRHYAHFDCYLDAGKKLEDLHAWQIRQFPYRILKEHNLLDRAQELADDEPETDPENIYDSASMRQSIEEDRK